jgi:hypothetical protein
VVSARVVAWLSGLLLVLASTGCADIWGFSDVSVGMDATAPPDATYIETGPVGPEAGSADVLVPLNDVNPPPDAAPDLDVVLPDVTAPPDSPPACIPEPIMIGVSNTAGQAAASLFEFTVPDVDGEAQSVLVRIRTATLVSGIIVSTQCDGSGGSALPAATQGEGGLFTRGTLPPGTYYLIFTWDASVPPASPYSFDLISDSPAVNASCKQAIALTTGSALTGNSFDADDLTAGCPPAVDSGVLPYTAYGQLYYSVQIPADSGWQITVTPNPGPVPWTAVLEAFSTCTSTTCAQLTRSPAAGQAASFSLVNTSASAVSYVVGVGASLADDVTGGGTFQISAMALPTCTLGNATCSVAGGSGICCGATCDPASAQNSCGTSCTAACLTSEVCTNGQCACQAGQKLCGTQCVDTMTDTNNCGACSTKCSTTDPHASAVTCTAGVCGTLCGTGYVTHCSGQCKDTQTDTSNCGTCGNTCAATEICNKGVCGCDATSGTPNYCKPACTNLQTDSNNCGTCGNACPAAEKCEGGTCVCPTAGQTYCSASKTCVALTTNVDDCGTCGNVCPTVTGATPTCVAGKCGKVCTVTADTACSTGCTNTKTDSNNCGACGTACTGGKTCQAGACSCPTGETFCGSSCVNPQISDTNCGTCGNACTTTDAGAPAACQGGVCLPNCTAPQVACGSACVTTSTDPNNCGKCGTACTGATPNCCGGACTNVATDNNNCQACGTQCTGATPNCCGGACTNVATDNNNCQGCGTVCVAPTMCQATGCM